MTKNYNSPMLQIVSINSKDIIATSGEKMGMLGNYDSGTVTIAAPDRFHDDWDAGY